LNLDLRIAGRIADAVRIRTTEAVQKQKQNQIQSSPGLNGV
jgi:hypothetical protein